MNKLMRALIVAEEVADRHGCVYTFKRQYEQFRSEYGILDSIKLALAEQKLLETYQARG